MKTLINLRGLSKKSKLDWIREQNLENYFLDIDTIRKLYAYPELTSPGNEIMLKSYSDTVFKRYIESLCIKLSKGSLVILDTDGMVSDNTIESLALVFGYTVFYKVWDIPQDYLLNYKKYNNFCWSPKKQSEIQRDIDDFLSIKFLNTINTYDDVLNYWKDKFTIIAKAGDSILHISDLHSNIDLFDKLPSFKKYKSVIFHGDYIDGPEKGGSRKLLDKVINNQDQNITWLEGNHELRVRKYLGSLLFAEKKEIKDCLLYNLPNDFLTTTAKEFTNITNPEEYLLNLNKKLKTHLIIKYDNSTEFICTHAGFKWKEQLDPKYIGSVIYGNRDINRYDREFSEKNKNNEIWSIHAHCKYTDPWNATKFKKVVNLDPHDEFEVVCGEQINNKWKIWQILKK